MLCDLMAFQVLLILLRSVRNEDAPNVTMLLQVFDSHVLVFVQAVTVLLYMPMPQFVQNVRKLSQKMDAPSEMLSHVLDDFP